MIYSKEGDKVVYNGWVCLPEVLKEANKYLTKGEIYTIDHIDVFNSYSKVYLKEFEGKSFNSVLFDTITPERLKYLGYTDDEIEKTMSKNV